jgi:FkbM family methyltransferase
MIKKLQKFATLLRLNYLYPRVVYYNAPWWIRLIGILSRPGKTGFFSQHGQDELIYTELFDYISSDNFPRLFIDIGCNHPTLHSNSYFFETNQNFQVIAVDALSEAAPLWKEKRPNADLIISAVGDHDGYLSFDVVEGGTVDSMFSSVSGASQKATNLSVHTRSVVVRRIENILDERGLEHAGILSIDIEGYELEALNGIDFSKFMSYIVIIENNADAGLGSNTIRNLMLEKGYIYYARVWNLDDIFVHPRLYDLC